MKNSLIFTACALSMSLSLLSSCTDVELCSDAEHPHTTPVVFDYDWSEAHEQSDSMYVIAYRVIKCKYYSMAVNSTDHLGRFIYGAPAEPTTPEEPTEPSEPDTPEAPDTPSNPDTPTTPDTPSEGGASPTEPSEPSVPAVPASAKRAPESATQGRRIFPLNKGEYKFFTFALDDTELKYNNVDDFMNGKTESSRISDIYLEYKVYKKGDPNLKSRIKNWDDYNPYAGYIQSNVRPVYFDSIPLRNIDGKAEHIAKFTPRNLSQNIDVYFDISKDVTTRGFVVDSVEAEVSGIPLAISIGNGYIDIRKTSKMLFDMELQNKDGNVVEDTEDNTSLVAHANIDVTGIVKSATPNERTGPGIMQVIIYTHAFNDEGVKRIKRIQGKINIYNALEEANLIEIVNMGKDARRRSEHGVLNIKTDLVLKGEQIVDTPNDDNGIDQWTGCEDIFVDI